MDKRRGVFSLIPLLMALSVLLIGCDGSSPTEPVANVSPFAGIWQGTTEQGKSLSFTVGGSAEAPVVTAFDVTVQLDELTPDFGGTVCLAAEIGVETSELSIPIVDNGFVVDIPGDFPIAGLPGGTTLRFEGVLHTTASASGLLMAETNISTCVGRGLTGWTAQKT